MPELPEVEHGRRVAESVAHGRTVVQAHVASDRIVFPDGPDAVKRALKGRTVRAVKRWGKLLWLELDRGPCVSFHFGMTGAFRTKDRAPLPLAHGPGREEPDAWPPKFCKIELVFDGDGRLAFTNARRLGRVRLHEDIEMALSGMGFDPLLALPPPAKFRELLSARSGVLKAVLLDQSFAAGVGNWTADEVLYQARTDPRRRACDLDPDEQKRLHQALRRVIKTAVRADAHAERFPRTWLFHRRWRRSSAKAAPSKETLRFDTIGGRTTVWCPDRQH
jgi:formamidopyrimidine-DNA glycosylase